MPFLTMVCPWTKHLGEYWGLGIGDLGGGVGNPSFVDRVRSALSVPFTFQNADCTQ